MKIRVIDYKPALYSLLLGLMLLPFSTTKDSQFHVISFGMPFLLMSSVFGLWYIIKNNILIGNSIGYALYVSFFYVIAMFLSTYFLLIFPEKFLVSIYRVIPNVIGLLLFLYIISFSGPDKKEKEILFSSIQNVLVMSGAIMAAYFLITFFLALKVADMRDIFSERVTGGFMSLPWGASNVIAATLIIPLFASLSLYNEDRKHVNTLYLSARCLMLVAITLTMSRTNLVVLCLGFLIFSIIIRKYKYLLMVLLFIMFLYALLYWYDPLALGIIYYSRVFSDDISDFNGRILLWAKFINYYKELPFTPIGYFNSMMELGHTSHNIFLTALVEQGLIGVIGVAFFLSSPLLWLWKGLKNQKNKYRKVLIAYLCGFISIIIGMQFEDAYFAQQYTIYLWVYLGLLYLCRSLKDNDFAYV